MSKILKVAVTGSAGSGKSTVCNRLKDLGVLVISSDALAREAVTPGTTAYKRIVEYFGKRVLAHDGNLNRQMLRSIIICDDVARRTLEELVHPEIIRLMQMQIKRAQQDGVPVVVVEVPLLFELGFEKFFDIAVTVSANREVLIKRLVDRDNISYKGAEALLNIQIPDEEKVRRADVVIKNDCQMDQMIKSVDLLYNNFFQKYLKESKMP